MPLNYKRILVPTDFSDISLNALDYAAMIANTSDAEVTLLHVYESPEQNTNINFALNINEILEKGINDKIADIKATNKNLWGIKFKTKVVNGRVYNVIHDVAKSLKIDLIVMGTHGVSGIKDLNKFIMGSNAFRVVNHAPCPVLTIRDKATSIRFKDIVVPIDNTKETKKKIDLAIQWAKDFNATVHLIALTAFFDELFIEIKDMKKMVNDIEAKLDKAGVPYVSKMIRHQRISESVLSYSKKIKADMVFIVTGQESGIGEMLLRSAARTVISESHAPVLCLNIDNK
ncbi:MAG TPA: universal stress protein [Chitinophagales bacterium]|nr:universal stress protein [Chitinophagales bacterium]